MALLALACALPRCEAQSPEELADLLAYAYTAGLDLGVYSVSGRSVQVYKLPFSYKLRSLEEHPWGLKLDFPVSFGVHDLRGFVAGENPLSVTLRTVTLVPGAEFQLPAGPRWVVKPSVEAGASKETTIGGDWIALYATDVGALGTFPRGRRVWSLGGRLRYEGAEGLNGAISDQFGTAEAGADLRFPLRMSVRGRDLDASVFTIIRHYFSGLVFERLGADPIEIDQQYEIGFTLGTEPRLRLWGLRLPRVGASFRFGGSLESYRINFGFPF